MTLQFYDVVFGFDSSFARIPTCMFANVMACLQYYGKLLSSLTLSSKDLEHTCLLSTPTPPTAMKNNIFTSFLHCCFCLLRSPSLSTANNMEKLESTTFLFSFTLICVIR